jgi:3-hydroxyisobutyrate dehydrogenase-like beta-hydroxyacid dehydrogenase
MTSKSTTPNLDSGISLLGLGAMGGVLAQRLLELKQPITVWNRTPARADALVAAGAARADTVTDAVLANPVVITCLFRYASVRETLDPVADSLRGRTLIDLTTTTPDEARELGLWADAHGIDYLNGVIMAPPQLIGEPGAQILYSGSRDVYDRVADGLSVWAASTYDGPDPGAASLIDLAMLSAMYQMFAGLFHGAAMAGAQGMTATEFATRAIPFLEPLIAHFAVDAAIIDGGDYTVPGQQSLEFSDLSDIVRASDGVGVDSSTIGAVQALIRRQRDAGFGSEGFARIHESLRSAPKREDAA